MTECLHRWRVLDVDRDDLAHVDVVLYVCTHCEHTHRQELYRATHRLAS
jgi:hypothetical protein